MTPSNNARCLPERLVVTAVAGRMLPPVVVPWLLNPRVDQTVRVVGTSAVRRVGWTT